MSGKYVVIKNVVFCVLPFECQNDCLCMIFILAGIKRNLFGSADKLNCINSCCHVNKCDV